MKEQFITEPEKKVPVIAEYDVAVCGGGIAGIAAALAAARNGAKVLLIEKQFALGGLATLGLITIYLPLCDGNGRQVSFGLAEELLRLSVENGREPGHYGKAWFENGTDEEKKKERYEVSFNAQMFALLAEKKLLSEGVEILYGTSVCSCAVENGKITALLLENKTGRTAVAVKSVVDCTGDADIFAMAGAETETFKQGNILASWYYAITDGQYRLHPVGFCDIPDKDKNENNRVELLSDRRFTGLDGKELSEMVEMSHASLLSHFLRDGKLSEKHMLTTMATIPQIRMTRRPVGAYTLDDTEDHKYFADSIGLISDWRKPGPIYEVPFRCLYGQTLCNCISAGRCISVTDAMWDISRVIPCCAVTGQAAGTAAALCAETGDAFALISTDTLQKKLVRDGVVLHI